MISVEISQLLYWTLFLLQGCLIFVLWKIATIGKGGVWESRVLFSPIMWVALWYTLAFLSVQLILPVLDFPILGLELYSIEFRSYAALRSQFFLTVFLISVATFFWLTVAPLDFRTSSDRQLISLSPIPSVLIPLIAIAGILGLVGIAYLLQFAGEGPRSQLLNNTSGRLAYAASFCASFMFVVIASILIRRRRIVPALILLGCFCTTILMLGGRGRALWPFVHVLVFFAVLYNVRVRSFLVLTVLALVFVTLQFLDPLLLWWRDRADWGETVGRYSDALVISQLFLARTFDGFHNFSVISALDQVAPDILIIFNNPSQVFMRTYYPEVWDSGVGFPATLPGQLWLAGGPFGVAIGGAFFGILVGLLHKMYWGMKRQASLWLYVIAIPWISGIQLSYFDQVDKVLAAIAAPLAIVFLDKFVTSLVLQKSAHSFLSGTQTSSK